MSGKWNGRLRGDRGMTLTELIASLAIAFILMSFLIRMYTYTGNMFETSASADDLRRTTQVIVDYLEDRISCAESLVISREELTGDEYGHEILFSRNGRIYCDGEAIPEEKGLMRDSACIVRRKCTSFKVPDYVEESNEYGFIFRRLCGKIS